MLLACALLAMAPDAGLARTSEPKVAPEIAARLNPAQLTLYKRYLLERGAFDRQHEMYWAMIEERRDNRRRKRAAGQAMVAADYVAEHPPKYAGVSLPPDIAKIVAEVRPTPPETPLPTVADFLEGARSHYGFVPTTISEREFKRRYAAEALAVGLSKSQVVRVYALETGGQGTFDMQSGIDPITKRGKAISSALGYAQLLHANSINELVRSGDDFIRRLEGMAASPRATTADRDSYAAKIEALRAMLKVARSVPNEWRDHVKLAQTAQGLGIHALNLDGDIGPWLQVVKLKGLLVTAAEAGRAQLTGAELELMNLAGPRTGLEMMEPVARPMPTSNFFSQGGYSRNGVVRDRTAAELLKALDERMEIHVRKAGAVEFAAVFDELIAGRGGSRDAPTARSGAERHDAAASGR